MDLALHAARHIVHQLGRDDVSLTLWDGRQLGDLLELREQLQLNDVSTSVAGCRFNSCRRFATADVALCPDPKNPLNDVSTMNKTMEYMSFSVPVVAFDLLETRVSAGDSGLCDAERHGRIRRN